MTAREQIDSIATAAIRSVFAEAAHYTTPDEVREWLYQHENELPFGVRKLFFAAANAAVQSGAYEHAAERAQHQGDT